MKRSLKTPAALAILLTAIAGPAFAGNYAEGDPRPAPLTASTSRAAVMADTQRWLQTAPDQGYPQGNPRAVVSVSSNSRAVVQADTMIWMRSGLAAAQLGEAGADISRPVYQRAAADYAQRRAGPGFAALVEDIKHKGVPATTGFVRKLN
ncbi:MULTISPECIES: hypothetical protein [unclassified Variovorax]|jgi:hypothetical protein|nr:MULTISPECIES: hypothetical protein [unclassified Variovorax]RSZ29543.1 hypothetical protein EJO70_33900 [Variovorax sp. 553]RSZ30138.1 hypothetical protein EJO71_33905 [Variovorax sp. 679]